jgi:single-strand DNA-binding protein
MSNFFIVEGNLVREPETKLVGQRTLIKFSIAENQRIKDANGNWADGAPSYYDMNFWTEKPDYWLKRLGKGVSVLCRGNFKQDKWEKDGQKYSKINFTVTDINGKWLPELNAANSSPQTQSAPVAPASAPATTPAPASDDPEDIPF